MPVRPADRALIDHVNRLINRGDTRISLPGRLVAAASEEARAAVRDLCRINGVEIAEVRM